MRFSRSRRRRIHPGLMEEMVHGLELDRRDPMRILLLASLVKDDFPWLYELGVDAYRASGGNGPAERTARHRFLAACKLLRRGPFLEMAHDSKDSHYVMHEIMHVLEMLSFDEFKRG